MNRSSISSDFPVFTSDPFVDPQVCAEGRKKSVEEILQGINGFRFSEPIQSTPKISQVILIQSPNIVDEPVHSTPKLKQQPLIKLKQSITEENHLVDRISDSLVGKDQNASPRSNRCCQMQLAWTATHPETVTTNLKRTNESPTLSAALEPPLIDIRDFAILEKCEALTWEPIPGAFELDPDYFDYHPSGELIGQHKALNQELTQVISPPSNIEASVENREVEACESATHDAHKIAVSETQHSEAQQEQDQVNFTFNPDNVGSEIHVDEYASQNASAHLQDELSGIIYAQDKQVIFVDGRDGYHYIDLTCFDLSQASFEANRIRIRTPQQQFEIDYRNLTHVLFANRQEVELAAFDPDYHSV